MYIRPIDRTISINYRAGGRGDSAVGGWIPNKRVVGKDENEGYGEECFKFCSLFSLLLLLLLGYELHDSILYNYRLDLDISGK